jgi:hypothetical protein
MEARGNQPSYPAQGNNVARSSLNYGPLPGTQARIFGWQEFKRKSLADDYHTYALEWTPDFMRFYIDTRLQSMLTMHQVKQSFFERGNFPKTAKNGTDQEVVITDIWSDSNSAPFNQSEFSHSRVALALLFFKILIADDASSSCASLRWLLLLEFHLIISLAAGGTSGWFPDGYGDKPWYDTSGDKAMAAFFDAQDTWSATWPSNEEDRAFIMCVDFPSLPFLYSLWLTIAAPPNTVSRSRCTSTAISPSPLQGYGFARALSARIFTDTEISSQT